MAKSNVSFKYEGGPDWKPRLHGQRFKPRISRALDQFIERAENHKPDLIPAISHIDLSKTNPWVTLIAQALWARLAPEAGVALPEIDIFPTNLWPTSARKGTTLDGQEYWVQTKQTTLDGPVAFCLVCGSPTNPTEIQKVEIYPREQSVFLTIKRGARGYPTFSTFGSRAEIAGGYNLNDWVAILEVIHLYGEELTLKGDDRIFWGANPLALILIDDIQHKIRSELHNKQKDRSPRFFPRVHGPGQPPQHKPTSDLIRALIGWEIAALAVESIQAASVSEAKESIDEFDLTQLTKLLNQMDPYLHIRNKDKYLLSDLEEALADIDRITQNKQIPTEIAERILAARKAIEA